MRSGIVNKSLQVKEEHVDSSQLDLLLSNSQFKFIMPLIKFRQIHSCPLSGLFRQLTRPPRTIKAGWFSAQRMTQSIPFTDTMATPRATQLMMSSLIIPKQTGGASLSVSVCVCVKLSSSPHHHSYAHALCRYTHRRKRQNARKKLICTGKSLPAWPEPKTLLKWRSWGNGKASCSHRHCLAPPLSLSPPCRLWIHTFFPLNAPSVF